jgi:hypothetical protein
MWTCLFGECLVTQSTLIIVIAATAVGGLLLGILIGTLIKKRK